MCECVVLTKHLVNILDSVILIDANQKVLLKLHLLSFPVLLDRICSGLPSPLHHGYSFPC